ncbi:MAG: FAD:protein FMN transferase [Victivallaceae bacterium]|nr:FAD:protein FMN transferase [Victivallaceae bacterium]MDD3703835.1 FAD:protein FMN transferase [Victivallaceae bacterium]MDD4318239.1 FAD:protein FMN transferase [Victivallaceae bacterium]MDD5663504.1 FAD:protein FMN transferase [Victivallaceae bacterium]NLK83703.1 FAD:protein FMN transferase [Lentisphaerota bacterium]
MNEQIFMSRKQTWLILMTIALISVAGVLINQRTGRNSRHHVDSEERQFPIMSTIAQIKFYGTPEQVENAANLTQDVFEMVEKACNTFDPESELFQLNRNAFAAPFKCSTLLWEVLSKAREAYRISDGMFDPSVRPLMTVWGFYRKRSEMPPQEEIKHALNICGMDKVVFDDDAKTVSFTVDGVALDLGGVAKGYAVDMAAENVLKTGVRAGTINLGGNIFCLPETPPGRRFYTVSIRNPLDKNKTCGVVRIVGKSVATSGNYERYVTFNGKNYTHIINPQTGMPVEDMLSVTVISNHAVDADLLSTAVFTGGVELAEKLYREFPDVQFLIMCRSTDHEDGFKIIKIGNAWDSVNPTGK